MSSADNTAAGTTADEAATPTYSYNFSVKRLSDTLMKSIFWVTFGLFLFTTPPQWIGDWFHVQSCSDFYEWMIRTFGLDPGKVGTEPWRIVTHMFMHGGLLHFAMNMLVLVTFYKAAREYFPGKTWLVVYFGAGIGGALFYSMIHAPGELAVGASGGVMGMWGASIAALFRYRSIKDDERPWENSLTLGMLLRALVLQFALEFLIPNVAHSVHIAGILIGFGIGMLLPMWQQPRLVASRKGVFQLVEAEVVNTREGRRAQRVVVQPTAEFDPAVDFLAVECDMIDIRRKRRIWYKPLVGTVPAWAAESSVAHVASSRLIFDETPTQYINKARAAKGEDPVKESGPGETHYGVTIGLCLYIVLASITLAPAVALTLAIVGAVLGMVSWLWDNRLGLILDPKTWGLRAAKRAGLFVLVVVGGIYFDAVETVAPMVIGFGCAVAIQSVIDLARSWWRNRTAAPTS